MKIVVMSDTHGHHNQISIPDGDLLIHCGDFTQRGQLEDIQRFDDFLAAQPHRYKIVVAGNHDIPFSPSESIQYHLHNCLYLQDDLVEIEGIRFYGAPWRHQSNQGLYTHNSQCAESQNRWKRIPQGVDILITHRPPYGIADQIYYGDHKGCQNLLEIVQQRKPKFHLFGHVHDGYGKIEKWGIQFINASIFDAWRKPRHQPISFEYRHFQASYQSPSLGTLS